MTLTPAATGAAPTSATSAKAPTAVASTTTRARSGSEGSAGERRPDSSSEGRCDEQRHQVQLRRVQWPLQRRRLHRRVRRQLQRQSPLRRDRRERQHRTLTPTSTTPAPVANAAPTAPAAKAVRRAQRQLQYPTLRSASYGVNLQHRTSRRRSRRQLGSEGRFDEAPRQPEYPSCASDTTPTSPANVAPTVDDASYRQRRPLRRAQRQLSVRNAAPARRRRFRTAQRRRQARRCFSTSVRRQAERQLQHQRTRLSTTQLQHRRGAGGVLRCSSGGQRHKPTAGRTASAPAAGSPRPARRCSVVALVAAVHSRRRRSRDSARHAVSLHAPCLLLLAPVFCAVMLFRGLRDRRYWAISASASVAGPTVEKPSIWVHAVSVGEVQACAVLVRCLHDRYPGIPLVVTTLTATGDERARALLGDRATVRYMPLDLPGSVGRFFDRVKPAHRRHLRNGAVAESLSRVRPAPRAARAGERAPLAARNGPVHELPYAVPSGCCRTTAS